MAELKISESEIIKGTIDEIIDYLNKRNKKLAKSETHKFVIEPNVSVKGSINTILDHYKLSDKFTSKRIEILNIGSDKEMAIKLIEKIILNLD